MACVAYSNPRITEVRRGFPVELTIHFRAKTEKDWANANLFRMKIEWNDFARIKPTEEHPVEKGVTCPILTVTVSHVYWTAGPKYVGVQLLREGKVVEVSGIWRPQVLDFLEKISVPELPSIPDPLEGLKRRFGNVANPLAPMRTP
jgi:hypothetical protein